MSTVLRFDAPPVERTEGPWSRRTRYAVLVCWLLLVLAALAVGGRTTSLNRLEADVASGHVRTVRVVGAVPPGSTGYGTVQVRWRRGLFGHVTEVVQARPRRAARHHTVANGDVVVAGDIGGRLSRLQPGLRVTREAWPSSEFSAWGWTLPGWMGLTTAGLWLAALCLLLDAPRPWRATRWAWFWLLASPVGIVAFLALSGPTPLLPAPRPDRRRLTGGWALLLSIVVTKMIVP